MRILRFLFYFVNSLPTDVGKRTEPIPQRFMVKMQPEIDVKYNQDISGSYSKEQCG